MRISKNPRAADTTPRLRARSPILVALSLATLIALLAGCDAKSGAKSMVVGPSEDKGLGRTIVVDPGYQSLSMVEKRVESVIADSAAAGNRIRIVIVDSGNSSAWTPVDLSAANDGDLRRTASNSHGRSKEQRNNVDTVMAAVRSALASSSSDGTGADLFGAIRRAVKNSETRQVVLITGGGVHQSSDLDMIAAYHDMIAGHTELADLLPSIPTVVGPDTEVFVLGAGDFSGVPEAPPIDFTEAVATLWQEACHRWELRSCHLADSAGALTHGEA